MNWLAHIYLSESTPEFRLGNILPDFARPNELRHLPSEIQRGIACHLRIDAFTDRHPIVRQSFSRIPAPHRRFAPILIDLIYDHFLAANWRQYSETPLPGFTAEIYKSFAPLAPHLPQAAAFALHRMSEQDWLTSYATLPGIELTLARISARFSRPVNLTRAIPAIVSNYESLRMDFCEYFPELVRHTRTHLINTMRVDFEGSWPDARRDEGAYPQRSVTEEQRSSRAKDPKDTSSDL